MRAILLALILTISYFPAFAEDDPCSDKEGAELECCKSCVENKYSNGHSKLTDSGIGSCDEATEDSSGDLCCCSPKK